VFDGFTPSKWRFPFRDLSYDPTKRFGHRFVPHHPTARASGYDGVMNPAIGPRYLALKARDPGIWTSIKEWGSISANGSRRYRFDGRNTTRRTKKLRASGNDSTKFTPHWVGTLTVNPDFSDALWIIRPGQNDALVLFQPRQRNFFLQDSGDIPVRWRGIRTGDHLHNTGDTGRRYSRAIWLATFPVSIMSGGTANIRRYAGLEIGALRPNQRAWRNPKHNQVFRLHASQRIGAKSKLGMRFSPTAIRPDGTKNTVVAGDRFPFQDYGWSPADFDGRFGSSEAFRAPMGEDEHDSAVTVSIERAMVVGKRFPKQVGADFTPAIGLRQPPRGFAQY